MLPATAMICSLVSTEVRRGRRREPGGVRTSVRSSSVWAISARHVRERSLATEVIAEARDAGRALNPDGDQSVLAAPAAHPMQQSSGSPGGHYAPFLEQHEGGCHC